MYRIDKSVFSAEELAQYEALIAKAKVDDPATETPAPEVVDTQKSASPELTAALADLADLRKSFEMKEMTQIAKKYAPLGKKEDELAQRLYEMKKSDEANYNAYIAVLDESLGLVEKSGVFAEIGKSASGVTGGSVESKIEAAASEIMKSDVTMTRDQAIAKAWMDHPELIAEYDAEYKA